jgi:HEAT repeat protein
MILQKLLKATAFSVLVFGTFVLVAGDSLIAASKAEEAKKAHETIKTSKDPKKVAEALEELGKLAQIMKAFGEPALSDIEKKLDDKDAGVRAAAAHCYGRCDPPADTAVPKLVKLLKDDKDATVRIEAVHGLAAMGNKAKAALPTINDVIKAEDKTSKLSREAKNAKKTIGAK